MAEAGVKDDKPKIRQLEGSDLRYLCGKDKVLFENGVCIGREDFDGIKSSPEAVRERIAQPNARPYDWPYACTTGILRRKAVLKHAPKPLPEPEVKAEVKPAAAGNFSASLLVLAVMAAVGVGSAVMSAYHTSAFLYEGGKPAWASLFTGVMLILFSGTAFTAARYFLQEAGALRVFALFFIAAGLAVISYSMFSTLTVNFNQFKWRDNEEAAAAVEGSELLAAHRERIRFLEEEIQGVSGEIERLEGEAEYWRTQSWRRYDEIAQRLNSLTEYRRDTQAQRLELVSETPRLVEVEAVSQETIYSFLAGLFAIEEETMRFFVYVVPACLYDILAPFALSVVLFLLDRRRERREVSV
jgi:hypothetical protein